VNASARDRGDIVLGWLTRLVVVISVVGLLGFDAIAVAQGKFQAADRATTAASAASSSWTSSKNLQTAFNAAYATAQDGDTIETDSFRIAADGTVTLRLHHTATTLLLHRIGALRHFAETVETGTARPGS
jgi:hypothetical protein